MRTGRNLPGYTIVEVMIFLAVSGFMFVIAAAFVSGKQSNAEFKQSMNDITSQVQHVINSVSNGEYPNEGNFACAASGSGPVFSSARGDNQGANQDCMFVGQVIQFGVKDTNGSGYYVYTVAGNRCSPPTPCTTDNLATSLTQTHPQAVYKSGIVDLTDKKTLEWGLQATGMYNRTNRNAPIGAVGFFGGFNGYSISGTLASGAQNTTVSIVPGSGLQQSEPAAIGEIAQIRSTTDQPDIVICFKNGTKRGSVTIGGNNGQRLTVTEQLGSNVPGVCP